MLLLSVHLLLQHLNVLKAPILHPLAVVEVLVVPLVFYTVKVQVDLRVHDRLRLLVAAVLI